MLKKTLTVLLALALLVAPGALASAIPTIQIGDAVPEFELTLTNGETFKLSEHLGKVVVVDLWATWCPPCVESMPVLQQLADEYPDEIVIVGVNCGDKEAEVQAFVEKYGYTFPNAIDEELDILYNYFPTQGIPYTVFIDAEGNLAETHLGGSDELYELFQGIIDGLLLKAQATPEPADGTTEATVESTAEPTEEPAAN